MRYHEKLEILGELLVVACLYWFQLEIALWYYESHARQLELGRKQLQPGLKLQKDSVVCWDSIWDPRCRCCLLRDYEKPAWWLAMTENSEMRMSGILCLARVLHLYWTKGLLHQSLYAEWMDTMFSTVMMCFNRVFSMVQRMKLEMADMLSSAEKAVGVSL